MKTITQTLLEAYRDAPEAAAITLLYSQAPDQSLTNRQLFEGAAGFARRLDEAGIAPGEVVILIEQHGVPLVTAFFGAMLHGAIPSIMPFLTEKLSADHYRKSLEALFAISKPAAVVTYRQFYAEVEAARREAASVRAILLSEETPPWSEPPAEALRGLNIPLEDVVLLQHSSGTTGLQKGVALSQQAIFNQISSYARALRLNASPEGQDIIVSWLPLYHDMGLIAGFLMPVLTRTPLVLMSPFDWVRAPYRLMQAFSHYRGTLAWLPNFAYNFCAQKIRDRDLEGVDLSSWRAVINCSEPMYWQSHQMFLERFRLYGLRPEALATCYAMAENVFAVTQGGIDRPVTVDIIDQKKLLTRQIAEPAPESSTSLRMLSAGPPIDNTRLKVVDASGVELPERHIGEIALQSDCMLTGYYQRPDLTRKAFQDGWYLTGDLGYLAKGEAYITGRKKDLIIVGGKNIYPQDLERLVSDTPGVHPGRVVAFGVMNPEAGTEEVVILAELDSDSEARREAIARQIRQQVNQGSDVALRRVHLVPRGWLLKTSSGKIARSANRDKYLSELAG